MPNLPPKAQHLQPPAQPGTTFKHDYVMDRLIAIMTRKRIYANCTTEKAMHIACLYRDCNAPICFGVNSFKTNMDLPGVHAEIDAARNLPFRSGAPKPITLCVVRLSHTGKLSQSKPCAHCIAMVNRVALKRGYRIQWVVYSNMDGSLERIRFTNLENEPVKHISTYYRFRLPMTHPDWLPSN